MADMSAVQSVVDISSKLITTAGILIGGGYAFVKTRKYRELEECIMINASCHHSLTAAKDSGVLDVIVQVEIQNVGGSVVRGLTLEAQLAFVPVVPGANPSTYTRKLDAPVEDHSVPKFAADHFTIDKGERNVIVFPCKLVLPTPMPLAYRLWVEYKSSRVPNDDGNHSWVCERMFPLV